MKFGAYYDKDGNPIDRETHARLHNEKSYVVVASTTLPNKNRVSTVWLGIDHGFGQAPVIFETMLFGPTGAEDLDSDRYSTLAQAQAGHLAMVARHSELKEPVPAGVPSCAICGAYGGKVNSSGLLPDHDICLTCFSAALATTRDGQEDFRDVLREMIRLK